MNWISVEDQSCACLEDKLKEEFGNFFKVECYSRKNEKEQFEFVIEVFIQANNQMQHIMSYYFEASVCDHAEIDTDSILFSDLRAFKEEFNQGKPY